MMRFILPVWLALLIAVSITPLSFKLRLHTIGPFHDFGHYAVYTMTGIFLWLVAERWWARVFAFGCGVALALGQEWVENRMYHAGFEWKDVRTDMAGLATGLALMLLFSALANDADAGRYRA